MCSLMLCSLRVTYGKALVLRSVFYSSQPEQASKSISRVVNVAIIGAPNSGKSTLINKILERKVNKLWPDEITLPFVIHLTIIDLIKMNII